MIRCRVKRCNPIIPSRQASSYIDRQNAIHGGVVQRAEKIRGSWICWCGLTEPGQPIDNDVGMPENVPARVDSDGGGHVSRVRVREPTGFEVVDCDLHGERLVRHYHSKVGRKNELGRGHIVHARDDAYRSGVA